jgi:hypothetical protein
MVHLREVVDVYRRAHMNGEGEPCDGGFLLDRPRDADAPRSPASEYCSKCMAFVEMDRIGQIPVAVGNSVDEVLGSLR